MYIVRYKQKIIRLCQLARSIGKKYDIRNYITAPYNECDLYLLVLHEIDNAGNKQMVEIFRTYFVIDK